MNSILFTSLKKGFLGYNMFPTCYQLICELMKKPYSSYGKFLDQMAHFQSRHLSSSCVPLFSSCANVECINTCGRTSHVQCIHSFSQHDIILDPGNLRSNVPDVDIPDVSFGEFILNRCNEFKDLCALSDYVSGRKYTYSQLKEYSVHVASALHKHGYRKGDVFFTLTVNLPEFTILTLATSCLGIIVSPGNPMSTSEDVKRLVMLNGSKAIFTIPALLPIIRQMLAADTSLKNKIKGVYVFGPAEDGAESFMTLMHDDGKDFPENISINPATDVLFMPFSSGTSGLPKGVMLSHRNVVANILQCSTALPVKHDDRMVGVLPFFHIYGLVAVQFCSVYGGACLVTVPKFEPELFVKCLQDEKISLLHAVPPIVLFLAKHPMAANFDLSALKRCLCGAAPLGRALTFEFQDRVGCCVYQVKVFYREHSLAYPSHSLETCGIVKAITSTTEQCEVWCEDLFGYGLTETSPVVNIDNYPGHPGSIGYLVPNTMAKLVDVDTGMPVKVGQVGEYLIDGPQKMLGYLNDEKATNETIDSDGWLHTGDLGFLRDDGMVVIEDRLKELIKYKGFQVPPAELESLLLTHPVVQDAGVIGIPDDEAGELPRAYVVLKPNAAVTDKDIITFVNSKVNPSKRLRGGVMFVSEIPKLASGKILRRVLRDWAKQES